MNDQNAVILKNWDAFESKLRELEELRKKKLGERDHTHISEFLYRGQADSRWKLETTLERISAADLTVSAYYIKALIAHPKIESLTDKVLKIPGEEKYEELLEGRDLLNREFPAYEYLAYLRHHGFPSPLLDWTASPYIAAFFAMDKVAKGVKYVSVYAFMEDSGGGKGAWASDPLICSYGYNIKTHKRHFMQQSGYTTCTKPKSINKQESELFYAPHEEVFSKNEKDQDILWKFNIPTSERPRFLQKLQTMNINSFSLFGTEDSLMDSIATEEFLLKGNDF